MTAPSFFTSRIRHFGLVGFLAAFLVAQCGAERADSRFFYSGDMRVHVREANGILYYEAVPRHVHPEAALPMVVYFHGRASAPEIPDEPLAGLDIPVRLLLPQAPEPLGDGFSWIDASAARGESRALVRGLRDRSAELALLLAEFEERHPTVGKPIVTGFSQGGELTFTLALHHPERVGAAFPLSGYVPPSLWPAAPREGISYPRIRATHGLRDPLLRHHRTEEAVGVLGRRGFDVELVSFPTAEHELTPRMEEQLRIWLRRELLRVLRGTEPADGFAS